MTDQEQQIALCEWADKHGLRTTFMDDDGCEQVGLLDTSSLDVLHEMEMKLEWIPDDEYCQAAQYYDNLVLICGIKMDPPDVYDWHLVTATAPQRREAMLRTLNLWK